MSFSSRTGSKTQKNTKKSPATVGEEDKTNTELLAQMKKCSVSLLKINMEPYLAANEEPKESQLPSNNRTKKNVATASSSRPTKAASKVSKVLQRVTRVGNNLRTPVRTRSRAAQMAKKVSDKYRRHSRTIGSVRKEHSDVAEMSAIIVTSDGSDEKMGRSNAPAIVQNETTDTRWPAPEIHVKEEVIDLCDDTMLDENVEEEPPKPIDPSILAAAAPTNVYNIVFKISGFEEKRSHEIRQCLADVIHGTSQTADNAAVASSIGDGKHFGIIVLRSLSPQFYYEFATETILIFIYLQRIQR